MIITITIRSIDNAFAQDIHTTESGVVTTNKIYTYLVLIGSPGPCLPI